jgi:hypothetical protein
MTGYPVRVTARPDPPSRWLWLVPKWTVPSWVRAGHPCPTGADRPGGIVDCSKAVTSWSLPTR